MRIHPLAMLALLAATFATGCGSSREVSNDGRQNANAYGCDVCHGYPPPPFFPRDDATEPTHPKGVTGAMCYICHPATVLNADGHTINASPIDDGTGNTHIAHRDGQVEAVDYKTAACDSCHGTPPDTGRHVFHVTTRGLTCGDCHRGFDPVAHTADDQVHMNGQPDVILPDGTVITTYDRPDGSWPDAECAQCHAAVGD